MDWVKEKMQQARLQRTQMQKQEDLDAADKLQNIRKELTANRSAHSYSSSQKLVWLATGMTSGAIIVSLVWWTKLIYLGGGTEIDRLQSKISEQVQEPPERTAGRPDSDGESVHRTDGVLARTASAIDLLPPPAAGTIERSAGTDANTSLAATEGHVEVKTTPIHSVIDAKPQEPEDKTHLGAWAINVASLQRRVDAETFAAKAHSKGVAAEIDQVRVSGKTYWRVQLPGFSSADEARTKVDEVEEKLGLKGVWIVKRY